jgi:hypothetical protein
MAQSSNSLQHSLNTLNMRRPAILVAAIFAIAGVVLLSHHAPTAATVARTRRRLVYGSSYRAHIYCGGPSEDIIANSYIVFLHWGYSLAEHKQTVSDIDLDPLIKIIFEETANHGLYYSVELEEGALEVVRADWGVDMVECDRRAHLIERDMESQLR